MICVPIDNNDGRGLEKLYIDVFDREEVIHIIPEYYKTFERNISKMNNKTRNSKASLKYFIYIHIYMEDKRCIACLCRREFISLLFFTRVLCMEVKWEYFLCSAVLPFFYAAIELPLRHRQRVGKTLLKMLLLFFIDA